MVKHPSLTTVVHAIVKRPPNGMDARTIASMMSKPYQTLMSELSNQPGHKLGADLVLELADLAGSDEVAHFVARQCGGVFVKLPEVVEGGEPVQLACLHAVKEFGELMAEVGKDLADGNISREDCDSITREGHESVTATMALLKLVGEAAKGAR